MTEVQKVSIGGYAFTLEVEAYTIVKQYLDELEAHYAPLEGGAEVMEGFEERMAELLYEKCADDGVASVEDVRRIIDILGKPSAIESEDDPQPKRAETETARSDRRKEKKRLYRDPTNKVLGGVCSGLAAYFKVDVVLVRVIFIGLFILGMVVGNHFFGGFNHFRIVFNFSQAVLLTYIALWIAMPAAKTVQQRWEMGVAHPPAGGTPRGSGLGRVLRIFIGCMLLLVGVAGMTAGLATIFGRHLLGWDLLREMWNGLTDYAPEVLPLVTSFFFKVDVLLLYFLPLIGMMYGGIMMVFDLKTPSWRPGLVIFLLWVAALVVFIILTLMGLFHAGLMN